MKRSLIVYICLIFIATAFLQALKRGPEKINLEDELEAPGSALNSLNFWSRSRAYPHNEIPANKYYKAFQAETFKRNNKIGTQITGTTWQSIGPNNWPGRCLSVAVNPVNPNSVYLGSASGGLWVSRNGAVGGDWQRVTLGYPALGISAIAIDPIDTNIMYIGTGEVYRYQYTFGGVSIRTTRGSYGLGILKTTDGGITWTKSLDWTYNQERGIQALKMNPYNPTTIWAATTEGIYRSVDNGATWDLLLSVIMGEDIVINTDDTNKVIVSCGDYDSPGTGIYRTTDGGNTWAQLGGVPPFTGKTILTMYPANPDMVFASVADSTTENGYLLRTTDFGDNWTSLPAAASHGTNPSGQGWYSHYVVVHPLDSNIIVQAAVGSVKSTDGGATFTGFNTLSGDNHAFAYDPTDPNVFYNAHDHGISRVNFNGTVTNVSAGLLLSQFYNGFANSSSDSNLAISHIQDYAIGPSYYGSLAWPPGGAASDEAGWNAINQINDSIMFGSYRGGRGIQKRIIGVALFPTWTFNESKGAWNTPFLLSSVDTSVLYYGESKIHKSTDGGNSYFVTNGGNVLDGNPALSMSMSSTNADTVFVGTAPVGYPMHIFRTTNGGTSWGDITGSLPDRYPMDMAVDPKDSRNVYLAFGGFGSGHLFKSTNGGNTWNDITGSLPDMPTTAITIDPVNTNDIYVGNDMGAYASTDGGANWFSFSEGLPEAVIAADLTISPANRALRIATHGNSVYERKLIHIYPTQPHNYKTLSLVEPANNAIVYIDSAVSLIEATFKFMSGLPQSDSIDVVYRILKNNSQLYYSTKRTPYLGVTESRNITFDGSFTPADTGIYNIEAFIEVTDDISADDTLKGTIHVVYPASVVVNEGSRWNLISLPLNRADRAVTSIFPTATGGTTYQYTGNLYQAEDTLEPGKGYWMKFPSTVNQSVQGAPMPSFTIMVNAGWNLVGSVDHTIPAPSGGVIVSNFYGYGNGYYPATSLDPGKGYWVKTNASGMINLNSTASPKTRAVDFETFNNFTVRDGLGRAQTLYFAENLDKRMSLDRYEMPPVLPSGYFDLRFASNRILETYRSNLQAAVEYPIAISSAEYPLTVSWDIKDSKEKQFMLGVVQDGKTVSDIRMSNKGTAEIPNATASLVLKVSSEAELPKEFSLSQNYPNPFNPATSIRYALPKAVHVTLKVFDILGREVKTLVNEDQEAGYRTVNFDASSFVSGVYFYKIEAETFIDVKKMVVVK